jgi:hypothetical protein
MFAKRAAAKVEGIMQTMHIPNFLHATLHLSHFIVRPALSYGAELSALGQVHPERPAGLISVAEQQYLQHLRWALRVGRCTSRHIVYRECGEHPLQRDWLLAACRLHNRLIAHPSPLLQHTICTAVATKPSIWGQELRAAMDICGLQHVPLSRPIPLCTVAAAFDDTYACTWHSLVSDPRDPACLHRQVSTYRAWCDNPDIAPRMPAYLLLPFSDASQRMLAQARCGCCPRMPAHHDWHHAIPFAERICSACGQAPGDLMHILQDCLHPTLVHTRVRYHMPSHMEMPTLFGDAQFSPKAYACLNAILHIYPHIAPVTGINVSQVACRPADL